VNLTAGCKIPADLRLVTTANLKVDNSALTGESEPMRCNVEASEHELLESRNMLFLGTGVVEGSGTAVVVAVGDTCQMGRIMSMASKTNQITTLAKEIVRFVTIIAALSIATGATVFLGWYFWLRVGAFSFILFQL
jgi:sodium/potassium-transporting ATPase subunit alpha